MPRTMLTCQRTISYAALDYTTDTQDSDDHQKCINKKLLKIKIDK